MTNQPIALLAWLLSLFNPPPLASMSGKQKIGRAFLVTLTLLVACILTAMLGAVGIFVIQRTRDMLTSIPKLMGGLEIIFASVLVNAICVVVLLHIRKAERKLIPPYLSQPGTETSGGPDNLRPLRKSLFKNSVIPEE
jgi:hypothetical protein